MGMKILAKFSLETQRSKRMEKDKLPDRIAEVEELSMQQMLAIAESHENSVRLEKENTELKEQILDQSNDFALAIAELYEMQNEKEG